MKPGSTITTGGAFRRGDVFIVDVGPDSETVKVTGCTGTGPYTVAVRRYRWFDRMRDTTRAYWRRSWRWVTQPVRAWRYSRCDARWCPRAAVLETDDYDAYCTRHAPEGAHDIEASDGDY